MGSSRRTFVFLCLTGWILSWVGETEGAVSVHQDSRCMCKCPKVAPRSNSSAVETSVYYASPEFRTVYINSSVRAKECDCQHVVLPAVSPEDVDPDSFCPRCVCKYQIRNLTIMKIAVILVVWILFVLVIYTAFLLCLDPLLNKRIPEYSQQRNEGISGGDNTPMRHYGTSVFRRIGHTQTRWKSQVQDQRRNIYDRHTMLN